MGGEREEAYAICVLASVHGERRKCEDDEERTLDWPVVNTQHDKLAQCISTCSRDLFEAHLLMWLHNFERMNDKVIMTNCC